MGRTPSRPKADPLGYVSYEQQIEVQMSPPTMFAIAAVGCAIVADSYFVLRVRRALALRHPDAWRSISVQWGFRGALELFLVRRKDKGLGDADLTARVDHVWLFRVAMAFAFVAMAGVIFFATLSGG